MGEKCHTEEDDYWESYIVKNGSPVLEGTFRLGPEDSYGYFKGTFIKNGGNVEEEIMGRCDGKKMYFLRTADDPRSYYRGAFNDNKKKLKGTQMSLSRTKEKKVRDTEEWQGTKITT